MSIESQRAGETVWTLIRNGYQQSLYRLPPLAAGQPEVHHYRLCYFQNDVATGDFSDIITITTTP